MASNYYEVLNVSKDADNKTISEAYKKMALKWHPDKNLDNIDEANRQFQQISQAYQVLSDSTKRLKYDRGDSFNNGRSHYQHHYFDFDSDECFLYSDDDDDDDCDEFDSCHHFISPEMLFRHFFFNSGGIFFHSHHFNDHQQNHRRGDQNRNASGSSDHRRSKRNQSRSKEASSGNDGQETCQTRTVNGKQWVTKTFYKDRQKIVSRYEDGELISKQIDGVPQKI